jgi:SulP family sulfate permease
MQFRLAVTTFGLTVAVAPNVERAVIAGVVLAVGAHLWREMRVNINTWTEGTTLHLAPRGVLYFASAPRLEDRLGRMLSEMPAADGLVVHLGGLGRIDVSGALGLRSVLEAADEAGLDTSVCDVPPQAQKIIARVLAGWLVLTSAPITSSPPAAGTSSTAAGATSPEEHPLVRSRTGRAHPIERSARPVLWKPWR